MIFTIQLVRFLFKWLGPRHGIRHMCVAPIGRDFTLHLFSWWAGLATIS